MSALPIPCSMLAEPTKSPPAPRGVMFINLREAAYRSGWAMETIAGRCRREWAAIGLAIQAKPADGTSKTCWHVREDADRAFARSKSPDLLPFDARDLTTKQRQVYHRRRELLDAWMESRAEGFAVGRQNERQITEAFVERCRIAGDRVSRGTLYRWLNDYCAKGKAGLVDARVKSHRVEPDRKWFEDQLERLYLSRRRSMRLTYDRVVDMAEDLGRPVPYGYKTAQRFLSSLDKKVVALKREGQRVYNAKFGRYVKRSHDVAANDLWMSDGHKFDVQVMYQGNRTRPILVSWMDIASRMIVGYTIEPKSETADAIRIGLKRGVQAYGTPRRVYIDNGSSYDAEHLQGITKAQRKAGKRASIDMGIFPRLGIEVTHAKAYNAKAKGELERFHRTICDRFSCECEGYMSGNPLNKPHTHAAEVKAGKLIGFDEFCERFHDWLIADYHHREHTGDGMNGKSPAVVYAERMREKRTLPADKMELELCRRTRATVGRNGVSIKLHGATLCFEAVELDSMSGETVDVILDDDRIDQASIYRLDGSRLCVARAVASVSIVAGPDELREAMKSRRRDRVADAKAQEARMRISDDPWERMHRRAQERAASSPAPTPDTYRPIRTPESPALRLAGDDTPPAREANELDDYASYADIEPRKAESQ